MLIVITDQHFLFYFANLAQLVEHLPRKEKVGGSTPLVGIRNTLIVFESLHIYPLKVDMEAFLYAYED